MRSKHSVGKFERRHAARSREGRYQDRRYRGDTIFLQAGQVSIYLFSTPPSIEKLHEIAFLLNYKIPFISPIWDMSSNYI